MIRRVHKKTRTGCSTCKRRRVKCGEEMPRCRNCTIHGASCVYEWAKESTSTRTHNRTPLEAGTPGAGFDDLIFSTRHMMLLHHFTTSTASTLHSNVNLKVLWQVEVPRLGLSFHFLMQAILAVSSLHLAHLKPDEWRLHWSQGVELYQMALGGANKEMQRVSDENRAAMFLFSALTCYFSLARSRCGDTARGPTMEEEDDFLEWVFLFRGTRSLLTPPDAAPLETGPLAPMIEIGRGRVHLLDKLLATDPVELKALADLQAEIRDRVVEGSELAAYDGAIHLLRRSVNAVHHQVPAGLQNTDILMWLFDVSHDFMVLLQARKPIAMALFACFSVLFRQLRRVWWVGDWSDWVLNQIYRALGAEEEEQWLVKGVQAVVEAEVSFCIGFTQRQESFH